MKKALLLLVLLSTVIGLSVSVRILSEPAGAAVYIDGEYRGNTPLIQNLLPGEYDLKLELRGFLTDEQKITVDQVTNLNTTLKIDSQWLGGQILPVSIVQFISSGTPPRSIKEKRLAQEILQMNFEEANLKSRDAGLDDTETEALTERFSISSLEKLKAKNSDSRFALVGTLLRVENSDGSVRARMELWLYDLEKGSIITSYSAEESGTGREASRMAIERCVKTLVPKVTSRIIAELPDPQIAGGRKRVNLYDISYDKFPEIKIAFNIKDDSGAYESEINPSDIRLNEDGTEIADFALKREYGEDSYLVMILDTSGSMENDIELLKSSAIEFIDNIPETTKISLIVYGKTDPGSSVDVFPPSLVQPFTSDREALKREINSLGVYGLTPLYNSIFLASKFLEGVDGTKILVAFTDGYNQIRGETRTLEEVKAALRLVKPITYILGFSRLAAQKELKALAQSVNGTFSYIENPEKIKDIYESVSREIRSANIITYKTLGGKELTLTIARDYVATLVLPISRPPEPPEATEGIGEGFEKDIVLKWETERTGDMDVKYELLFGKSPETLVTLANDLTEGYFELTGLELSTTYYWAVIASGRHSSTPSNIFSFTTITPLLTGGTAREKIDSGRYEEVIEKILGGEVSIAEDEKAVLLARAMAKNLQEGGSERYLQPVMENLEKVRLQFPRSPQIRAGMAELYLVMEEFEKARSELNEARRLGLEESWIVSLTARLNLATQGLRTARETLEEAVITGDAETLKESAGIYLEIGDSDRALELVREAREKEPENVSIARKEIEILRQTDRKEEALEVVEWALEIEPENESLLVSKVELLYETGQIEEALKFLEEVAGRIAPENVELLRLKAMILEELGNLEEVIEVLSRAIELSPEDVSLKNYYIMIGGEESERRALLEEDRKEVPEITLLTPKIPYTDRSNVIIKVKVSDNVGIEEVRINGEREATYYGKGTMQLAKRLELEGGENEVKIEALDAAGNRTSLSFSVFRDTLNPEIITEEPVYVKTTPDDITILFKDDTILSSISFNSEKIDIADREYSLTKTVQLEDSIMLRLLAEDIVGNYTEKTLQIIMDTEAPTVIVRNIPSTVEPEIDRQEIQLDVTDNRGIRRITLNGDELTPVDTIVAVVDLNPGKNDFELIAEDLAGNKTIHSFEIERIIKQQPAITVENPQTNQVTERRYTVKGRISNYRKDTVILSLNGIERAIPVINGEFSYELILETGTNTITITADNYGLKDSRTITVNLAIAQPVSEQQVVTTESRDISEALWIELTWDKDLADIDLHVYEPDEEHVYYRNKKAAGELDRDDTDGYGPEHYTLLKGDIIDGEYRIRLDYYATHGQTQPVNCRVVIKRYGNTVLDQTFTLRNDDDTVEVMKVGVRKEEYDAYIQDLYRDVTEALWIELTWDKNHADIDLHVYEPDEEHVYYENMKGAGELDRDDTDGYGPEHYTLLRERAIDGDYRIMLHYYATHEQTQPVNCRVVIKRYGVTILDRVFTLTDKGDTAEVMTVNLRPLSNLPPVVTKTDGTEGETTVGSNSFSWSGSDPDGEIAGYEYRKDGGDWVEYALDTGYVWEGYPQGVHTFEVRAQDDGGKYSNVVSWNFRYSVLLPGEYPQDGLIAYWGFNKGIVDGKVLDESGNGNDGTVMNTPEIVEGILGNGMRFHGEGYTGTEGDHVLLPDLGLSSRSSFTISLWVSEIDTLYEHWGEAFIYNGGDSFIGIAYLWEKLYFSVSHWDSALVIDYDPTFMNRFTHYCLVYDEGVVKAYIDGIFIDQKEQEISISRDGFGLAIHWWDSGEGLVSTRFGGILDEVLIYNRALSSEEVCSLYSIPISWNDEPDRMPTARSWLAAVNIADRIMVIGGGDRITKTPYAKNEIYNPITNSWETLTPMPTPRYALAAAEYNGKVYVFGGQQIFGNASPVNNVEIYDPVTDSWSTGSPMPNARCELAAATCGDKIYVISGLNYATRYNTLQIYSPGTDSWSVGAPLPKSFSQHAAVGYGGKVYVFGGMDNSRKRLDTVYIYDPQSDTWSSGTPAPTGRSELAAVVVGSKIYIFGGITKDFTEGLTTVDIYDPLSDSWQKGDPSLSKRSALAAASVGSKVYLIGGYLYGNPVIELNSVEAYSTE